MGKEKKRLSRFLIDNAEFPVLPYNSVSQGASLFTAYIKKQDIDQYRVTGRNLYYK